MVSVLLRVLTERIVVRVVIHTKYVKATNGSPKHVLQQERIVRPLVLLTLHVKLPRAVTAHANALKPLRLVLLIAVAVHLLHLLHPMIMAAIQPARYVFLKERVLVLTVLVAMVLVLAVHLRLSYQILPRHLIRPSLLWL